VQIISYQKFTETLTSPTHITLFKTEPLKGVGLLVMTPALGLAFVDACSVVPARLLNLRAI